jgi:hypothetical protein
MTDSMTKFNHRMTAEESIANFISYIEESSGRPVTADQQDWLYRKGYEIFDTYYIDEVAQVNLASQDDKDQLMTYFGKVQETLGKMFAHIMLLEFKLQLFTHG